MADKDKDTVTLTGKDKDSKPGKILGRPTPKVIEA